MGAYSISKVCMCQHGDANSRIKEFFMNPPGSVEGFKKKFILREIPFYRLWFTLRKR